MSALKSKPMKDYVVNVRNNLRLSQPQLAQIMGVHPLTVSRWERGVLKPTAHDFAILRAFATAFIIEPTVVRGVEDDLDDQYPLRALARLLKVGTGL